MRIPAISFKGYMEINSAKNPDSLILETLNEARPYLRQIGNSMPYPRDLAVVITEDPCDTYINAYDYNTKNKKTTLLAKVNEHTSTGYGLDFVEKIFKGLKKNNEKEFKNIAANFVTRLSFVTWEQHPIKPVQSLDDEFLL